MTWDKEKNNFLKPQNPATSLRNKDRETSVQNFNRAKISFESDAPRDERRELLLQLQVLLVQPDVVGLGGREVGLGLFEVSLHL